jgi:hypothetical protein
LVFKFKPAGFTADKYRETIKQHEAAGAAAPMARSYNVCYANADAVNK